MGTRSLKSHSIDIAGQKVSLKSDAAETHVKRLADLVNSRVRSVREGAQNVPTNTVLALVAIQFADDLIDLEDRLAAERRGAAGELRKVAGRLADSAGALERWVEEARQEEP
jgi:cell division protein ZapA (FtsZ GTPase activity inhibitor)